MRPAVAGCAALLVVLAGCGEDEPDGPPRVQVTVGPQDVDVDPTQYCVDGDGQRYATQPPILEVTPDTTIALTVSDAVAEAGWSVQVFDEGLENILGEVDVPAGEARFDEISTSDVVPPTFYLVVVEDSDAEECSGLSGAWPVGFIRTDGQAAPTSPTPAG